MSGVPSAFILVVVVALAVLVGVVMAPDFTVVDLVVVVAGVCDILVVTIFDELLLIVLVAGVVWAWADKLLATSSRAKS